MKYLKIKMVPNIKDFLLGTSYSLKDLECYIRNIKGKCINIELIQADTLNHFLKKKIN